MARFTLAAKGHQRLGSHITPKWMSWDDIDLMPRNDTEKQWPQEEYSKLLPSVCKDKGHQGLWRLDLLLNIFCFEILFIIIIGLIPLNRNI